MVIKGYRDGMRLPVQKMTAARRSHVFFFQAPSGVISGGHFKIIMRKWIYLFLCVLSTTAACHCLVLMLGDNQSFAVGAACVFFATLAVVFSHGHRMETIKSKHIE